MILGGIAAVLIPFSIAGIIIYMQLSKTLMEMTEETSVHMARDVSAFIDATLKQEIDLASSIAADPDIVKASKKGDYRVAQEELEALKADPGAFDVVVTDYTMPHITGLGLAEDLKQAGPQFMKAIRERLLTLPGDTVVWPGHNYGPRPSSTIEYEKKTNPWLGGGI